MQPGLVYLASRLGLPIVPVGFGLERPYRANSWDRFAVPRPGYTPSAELAREVQDTVAEHLGKPLRPEAVKFVTQLPKTRNAKILRRVIKGAYLGKQDLGDLSSLENPAAVEEIRTLAAR